MGLPESLKSHLAADATIAGLVVERIHPIRLPEGSTKPAIVYRDVGTTDQTDLDSGDGNLQHTRLQLDCWADTAGGAFALGDAVRRRMQSATISSNSFVLGACFLQDDYDIDTKLFRKILDCEVWYRTS